jgi:hypothetical protein
MTFTTYYATHSAAQNRNEANAIVHHINDATAASGDNRSWDATRAHLNALADSETQARLGITIEAEDSELMADEQ